jgi:hypothetical protein
VYIEKRGKERIGVFHYVCLTHGLNTAVVEKASKIERGNNGSRVLATNYITTNISNNILNNCKPMDVSSTENQASKRLELKQKRRKPKLSDRPLAGVCFCAA